MRERLSGAHSPLGAFRPCSPGVLPGATGCWRSGDRPDGAGVVRGTPDFFADARVRCGDRGVRDATGHHPPGGPPRLEAGVRPGRLPGARYPGWHRHMTLAMAAHACLTILRARELDVENAETDPPSSSTTASPKSDAQHQAPLTPVRRCHPEGGGAGADRRPRQRRSAVRRRPGGDSFRLRTAAIRATRRRSSP